MCSKEGSDDLGCSVDAEESPDLHLWEVRVVFVVVCFDGLELEDDRVGGNGESVEASEEQERTDVDHGGQALVGE